MKKVSICFLLILLMAVSFGCTNEKEKTISSEKVEQKTINLDNVINLIVERKYDEALTELEKINIKDNKNKDVIRLINQLTTFKEAKNLFDEKKYEEAAEQYQTIIDDKESFESLKSDSRKEVEKIKELTKKEKTIEDNVVKETFSDYTNERNSLKRNSTNADVIDAIPDSMFKKVYEEQYNRGFMDLSEKELLIEMDKIYPNAGIDINAQVGPGAGISDEVQATELVRSLIDESQRNDYELTATDQGNYFMVFGQMIDSSRQSMATNLYYYIYKTGVIEQVDRNGNPL